MAKTDVTERENGAKYRSVEEYRTSTAYFSRMCSNGKEEYTKGEGTRMLELRTDPGSEQYNLPGLAAVPEPYPSSILKKPGGKLFTFLAPYECSFAKSTERMVKQRSKATL